MNARQGSPFVRRWSRRILQGVAHPDEAAWWLLSKIAARHQMPDHASAGRKTFSQRFREVPIHLMAKVNGRRDEELFRNVGRWTTDILSENFGPGPAGREVLDFGCGLGRVLTALMENWPTNRFTGFDVDPMMLEWGKYLLHRPDVALIGSTTPLPDGRFNLVFAISVFTHLDESADYWLAEINRLLKPSGKAFLTFQDDTLFREIAGTPACPGTVRDTPLETCYVVGRDHVEGGIAMGTFYKTSYWERRLEPYFHVERTEPRGLRGHQSFSIVSPRAARPDWAELRRRRVQELEGELWSLRLRTRQMF